jgi:hypothetical protein
MRLPEDMLRYIALFLYPIDLQQPKLSSNNIYFPDTHTQDTLAFVHFYLKKLYYKKDFDSFRQVNRAIHTLLYNEEDHNLQQTFNDLPSTIEPAIFFDYCKKNLLAVQSDHYGQQNDFLLAQYDIKIKPYSVYTFLSHLLSPDYEKKAHVFFYLTGNMPYPLLKIYISTCANSKQKAITNIIKNLLKRLPKDAHIVRDLLNCVTDWQSHTPKLFSADVGPHTSSREDLLEITNPIPLDTLCALCKENIKKFE